MSNVATAPETNENNTKPEASVVDAVFDALLAWTDIGLDQAKLALSGSARAMDRTAKALEIVREKLKA